MEWGAYLTLKPRTWGELTSLSRSDSSWSAWRGVVLIEWCAAGNSRSGMMQMGNVALAGDPELVQLLLDYAVPN